MSLQNEQKGSGLSARCAVTTLFAFRCLLGNIIILLVSASQKDNSHIYYLNEPLLSYPPKLPLLLLKDYTYVFCLMC